MAKTKKEKKTKKQKKDKKEKSSIKLELDELLKSSVELEKKDLYFDSIKIEFNRNIFYDVCDKTNRCNFGPDGLYKEAALLYYIDNSIHLLSINAYENEKFKDSIGKAILIEVTGGKSKGDNKRYLNVEGVVGENLNRIIREGDDGVDWRLLLYKRILLFAQDKEIPYLFVNTEHSGIQQETEDFVAYIKQQPHEDVNSERTQSGFEYTHWLEKKPLPKKLVEEIRLNRKYNGEQYLDTWYQYNKLVLRRKQPQWNLGRGYCKGIEINVQSELKRLGLVA